LATLAVDPTFNNRSTDLPPEVPGAPPPREWDTVLDAQRWGPDVSGGSHHNVSLERTTFKMDTFGHEIRC
jgi:hypothetical protein